MLKTPLHTNKRVSWTLSFLTSLSTFFPSIHFGHSHHYSYPRPRHQKSYYLQQSHFKILIFIPLLYFQLTCIASPLPQFYLAEAANPLIHHSLPHSSSASPQSSLSLYSLDFRSSFSISSL